MFIAFGLQLLVKAPVMAIWAVCKIASSSWQWTTATAIAVAFVLIFIVLIVVMALPKFKKIQGMTDDLNRITRENLTGDKGVVRAYNAEDYQEKKFDEANTKITKNSLFVNGFMSLIDPVLAVVMSGLPLAIYMIGAYLVSNAVGLGKAVVLAEMMTFSSYAILVVMSFVMLVMIFIMLPRAAVSAKRINEVLETKSTIKEGDGTQAPIKTGEVQFVNVGFKYPDAEEYVLHDISFKQKRVKQLRLLAQQEAAKAL